MKKNMKFISIAGIILLVFTLSLVGDNTAKAGGLTAVSVTQTTYTNSAAVATTTIVFTPDTDVNSLDGILLSFESDYDISSVVNGDVTVAQANGGTDITKGTAAVSSQDIQIPITTEGDDPDGAITITIANSHITNPTSDETYTITITTYDLGTSGAFGGSDGEADTEEDQGAAAVIIGTNQVTISGTVDPTLTLSLSGTSCALGTLSTTNVETCSYDATVATNASNGYSAYIKEGATLQNSNSDVITAVTASEDVTPGGDTSPVDEQYGIGVDTTDTTDTFPDYTGTDTCANIDNQASLALPSEPLSTSDQRFAYASAVVDGSTTGVTTICHGAAIIGTTPAGAYSHTVTVTVTGNF
jgi:hypothetical protein